MAVLRIKEFSGIVPALGDRALPENFAVESVNTWLYGSELRAIRVPVDIIAIQPATRKIFRIPKRPAGSTLPPSDLADSVWVQFTDPDTDIVRGQLLEDSFERWYFCSPSTGPVFNTRARLEAGQTMYKLGVPGPNTDLDASGNNAWKPTIVSIAEAVPTTELGGFIHEIEFKIGTVAGATSYSNAGGSGSRTGIINMAGTTASFTVGGSASAANATYLINGNQSANQAQFTDIHQSGKKLWFDFGSAKIIDEVRWIQADTTDYGTWTWQGSNDASTWTDIGGDFEIGVVLKQEFTRSNDVAYRYYQLVQQAQPPSPMVSRAYLYTWANEFGEESSPSLPVLGAGQADDIWTIGNILDPPAPDPGYPLYTKKYLYRTVTGASGMTQYYRVNEVAIGTTTYADNTSEVTDAIIVGNLPLESTNWAPPPSGDDQLKGFVAMANGFLVGFSGNHVYMSEPYHFHAWPAEYKQATEYPIVGLGALGQTCVACTQGYPATATGTHPAIVSFTKATTNEPCMSRGSIVTTPGGIIYASQNGLVSVGPAGIQNVTEQMITRDDWVKDFTPQYIRACRYQNGYLALRDLPTPEPNRAFFIDPTALKVALTDISDMDDTINFVNDVWSGEVFMLNNAHIYRWDTPGADFLPLLWRSKEFQYPLEANFGCYAIYWDEARYSDTPLGVGVLPVDERVRLKVFANRRKVYDQMVPRNGRGVRLPSGFKADVWQFEIAARAPVYSLHVASTMRELKGA